jgi:hypothetical protein
MTAVDVRWWPSAWGTVATGCSAPHERMIA